jgi:hypothetical protein
MTCQNLRRRYVYHLVHLSFSSQGIFEKMALLTYKNVITKNNYDNEMH